MAQKSKEASKTAKPSAKAAKGSKNPRKTRRPIWRQIARIAVSVLLVMILLPLLWIASYRIINPPTNYYMLSEAWRLGGIEREWRDLEEMSAHLPEAAMAAEDSGFCAHFGLDFEAIERALEANKSGKRLRGGSTITQQVAKNAFLWPKRSWTRKGLEAGFAVMIEVMWPKSRIIEIYLNIAEFDEGVFGVQAASQHYFGKDAAKLTRIEASRLAAILPDPKGRSASRPGNWTRNRAASIAKGAATLRGEGRSDCISIASKA
ncbi:MAG: monofunctional biosynthetic peptidoglycan transglycosylase [Pseudomonadota bacterium]